MWEYIQETRDKVCDLEQRVQKAKDNVEQIQKLMAAWSKTPLFERKEGKHESLLNLEDRTERLKKRYDEIDQTGQKIHELVKVKRKQDTYILYTVKPVLRDHCHESPPVLTDHTILAEGPTFQYN